VDGIVLVDKPVGISSHKLTNQVRRELGASKAGHAGTLDPFASGLLIVLIGRARRVQRFFMGMSKQYTAVARFGAVSTTGDPEGEITETGVLPIGEIKTVSGLIRQRPPNYSAVRVDGKRAYERARAGEQFEVAEREVEVFEFRQLSRSEDRAEFIIHCSSGTYIRSLIADLGDAYTESLRRTRIGPFSVDDADSGKVIKMEDAFGFFKSVTLTADDAKRASHGVAVRPVGKPLAPTIGLPDAPPPDELLLVDSDGVVALAEQREDGVLKPVVGFRA